MSPTDLPEGLTRQDDGIYLDAGRPASVLMAAVEGIYKTGFVLRGLDYGVLCRVLYGVGPALAPHPQMLARVADSVDLFQEERKKLYRPVKIVDGVAEYFFEPQFLEAEELSDGTSLPERPVSLDFDEFVAELWTRGIRFGVQEAAVRAAIANPRGERTTAARRFEPSDPLDPKVVEVAKELHRSDAPKERADGRVDMTSFQNRFPQIKHGARLLQKVPGTPGAPGIEMSGAAIPPRQPGDVDLARYAGGGTLIVREPDGEFLVANQDGFLNVDSKSHQISITDKIISKDGVSGRTTGNLELMGAFEEFGDVQELRDVNGSDITVHGNVFGNINSSGGEVVIGGNLVGGKVHNAKGSIQIDGVTSGAIVQTSDGTVTMKGRADSCVITGTKVVLEEASNCEIFADEVEVKLAIGCAIAGRNVKIESAGPRRNSEMFVYVVVRDVSGCERELAELAQHALEQAAQRAVMQAEHDRLNALPEVQRYLDLADKLRKGEIHLTPAQVPMIKQLAAGVAPQVKLIAQLMQGIKALEAKQQEGEARKAELEELKRSAAARSNCTVIMVDGETLVRTLPLSESAAADFMQAPKDYKTLLRGPRLDSETLFTGSSGTFNWHGAAQA